MSDLQLKSLYSKSERNPKRQIKTFFDHNFGNITAIFGFKRGVCKNTFMRYHRQMVIVVRWL